MIQLRQEVVQVLDVVDNVPRHGQKEQWNSEKQAHDEQTPLTRDFLLPRDLLGVLGAGPGLDCLEPCRVHYLPEIGLADEGGDILDAGGLGREVYGCLRHAFERGQRLLQPARVVVVGHAADGEDALAHRHGVARPLHARDDVFQSKFGGVKFHRRPFRGQVHGRHLHPVELLQVALDGRHAVRARHAGDGEGELLG